MATAPGRRERAGFAQGWRLHRGDPHLTHSWNEFLFANTFLFDERTQPVTVVIPNFAAVYTVNYWAQAAAAVVVTIPLVILVLVFQRRIISGLTAGAVKG